MYRDTFVLTPPPSYPGAPPEGQMSPPRPPQPHFQQDPSVAAVAWPNGALGGPKEVPNESVIRSFENGIIREEGEPAVEPAGAVTLLSPLPPHPISASECLDPAGAVSLLSPLPPRPWMPWRKRHRGSSGRRCCGKCRGACLRRRFLGSRCWDMWSANSGSRCWDMWSGSLFGSRCWDM